MKYLKYYNLFLENVTSDVDDILDKINKSGLDSLTDDEKNTLYPQKSKGGITFKHEQPEEDNWEDEIKKKYKFTPFNVKQGTKLLCKDSNWSENASPNMWFQFRKGFWYEIKEITFLKNIYSSPKYGYNIPEYKLIYLGNNPRVPYTNCIKRTPSLSVKGEPSSMFTNGIRWMGEGNPFQVLYIWDYFYTPEEIMKMKKDGTLDEFIEVEQKNKKRLDKSLKKFNMAIIRKQYKPNSNYDWLKGIELSRVYSKYKELKPNFHDFILNNDIDIIMKDFDSFLKRIKTFNIKSPYGKKHVSTLPEWGSQRHNIEFVDDDKEKNKL